MSEPLNVSGPEGLPAVRQPASYDHATHQWVGQCPHGDVCSGCDALGYCTREEGRQPASEPASELEDGSSRQPGAVLARLIEAASPLTEWDFAALQHDYHGYRLVPISNVERLIGQIAHLRAALAAARGDTQA